MKFYLTKENRKKFAIIAILLLIMLCSVFIVSEFATSPENYKNTIQSIDEKKSTVMGITAGAAATSAILAAVPGEATTPIANQIMQMTSYLMIVVCVLVLEKSLLTVMGYLSFSILIPAACILFGIHTFVKKEFLKIVALKIVVFAVVIISIIPLSVKIGDIICDSNTVIIKQVSEKTTQGEFDKSSSDKNWLDGITDKLKNKVTYAGNYAKEKLNGFIDAIAVFIIAYCAIPIIVIVAVVWLFKLLFAIPGQSRLYDKNGRIIK